MYSACLQVISTNIMKAGTAVTITTLYLVLFYALLYSNAPIVFTGIVFLTMPIVMILMVLVILTDDSKKYPELSPGDEWGYRDKSKEDLGIV